ncbi:MAG: Asp-tRNA(Asn)/Glu-tRNA(Gln) amidotransferase subunit GatC [Promethearchaeota archaeon]|nr:MAG: Asp-tRNA(Asn)/Glu-tRNA(Gln) amidotransferase subunit GatC [Candidatus Lokiarchaeota archaeon]
MAKEKEFSKEEIEHISELALLELTDEEKEKFAKQLNDILKHFKKLNNLDTSKIEPTRHPIEGLKNVFRKDEVKEGLTQKEVLENAEHTKDGFIKAPRILKD